MGRENLVSKPVSKIHVFITFNDPHWARMVDYSPLPLEVGRPLPHQWELGTVCLSNRITPNFETTIYGFSHSL